MDGKRGLAVAIVSFAVVGALCGSVARAASYPTPTGAAGTSAGGAGGTPSTGSAGTGNDGGDTPSPSSGGCSIAGGRGELSKVALGFGVIVLLRRRKPRG